MPANDPERQKAEACWATCPHGTDEFPAWHRIYLYYFERIVRAASGDVSFTLPYWNYSAGGSSTLLPAECVEAVNGSPLQNALFNIARDPLLNGLFGPASQVPDTDVDLGALREGRFEGTATASGFPASVENIPHGMIHVDVGGYDEIGAGIGDMSAPPTAGRDPIFWLHHANIDRLWESWMKAGNETTATDYKNRSWYNTKWAFVEESGALMMTSLADLDQLMAIEPILYDALEQIPRDSAIVATGTSLIGRKAGPTPVSSGGVRVELATTEADMLSAAAATLKAKIVIDNVTADDEIATIFDVYLNLPLGNAADKTKYAGSFNLFGAFHEGMNHPRRFIFDVTDLLATQRASGSMSSTTSVSILPRLGAMNNAVTLGSVSLVTG